MNGPLKGFRKLNRSSTGVNIPARQEAAPPPPADSFPAAPLQDEKSAFCASCGTGNPFTNHFCNQCGMPLLQGQPQPDQQKSAKDPTPKAAFPIEAGLPGLKDIRQSFNGISGQSSRPAGKDEVHYWCRLLVDGSDEAFQEAFQNLLEINSDEVIPGLVKVLEKQSGRAFPRDNEVSLLLVIKGMEDEDSVQRMLAVKIPTEYEICRISALGYSHLTAALPYLQKALNQSDDMNNRIAAVQALSVSGLPEAIPILYQNAREEFSPLRIEYVEDDENPIGWSSSFGLFMLGEIAGQHRKQKTYAQTASWLTRPILPIEVMLDQDIPAEVRRMGVFHARAEAIANLAITGQHDLEQYGRASSDSVEKILLALAFVDYEPSLAWIGQAMEQSKASRYMEERLMAYECAVRAAAALGARAYENIVQAGFQEREERVRDAVAAAVLYQRATVFYPEVFNRLCQGKKETRMTLVIPLVDAAIVGDNQAAEQLNHIIWNDPDREVREWAASIANSVNTQDQT